MAAAAFAVACCAAAAGVAWLLVHVLLQLLQCRRQWRFLKHLPGPPPLHWLFGHASAFASTAAPMTLAGWQAAYGGAYRLRFFTAFGVVVTDPALVRAVLQSSKTYVPKDRRLYRAIEVASCVALPNVLTASDGEYWRLVRGAWMKCFTSVHLRKVLPILQDICARVALQIKEQATATPSAAAADDEAAAATQPAAACSADADAAPQPPAGTARVNACCVFDRITLDVIGHVSYGRDFGAVDFKRSRYLELVGAMLALMHEEMEHPFSRLLQRVRPDKSKALLRAAWDAANTAEVMRALAEPPPGHTIAGQLLGVRDPATGQPLTPQQLKSELCIATLAGFETTSNALSWTLASLAAHPAAMAALEQELDGAGLLASASNPQPPRFEWRTLGRLPYLQAVIREGLRLFSPAANGTWRLCSTTDIQLTPDLVIPKNTAVGVPWFAFGHSAAIYGEDAEAFRPERWLSSSSSSSSRGTAAALSSRDAEQAADAAVVGGTSTSGGGNGRGNGHGAASAAAAAAAAAAPPAPAQASKQPLQDPWSFSIGPRDCAGQALARLELQVVLATLVGAFQVSLPPDVGGWPGLLERRLYHTTLQARGGSLPLLLTPRGSSSSSSAAPAGCRQS